MQSVSALDLAGSEALEPVYIAPVLWHARSIACRIGMMKIHGTNETSHRV